MRRIKFYLEAIGIITVIVGCLILLSIAMENSAVAAVEMAKYILRGL